MEKLVNIDEFVESDLLYESNKSKVFKASHPESSRNIIVKQLNKQFPSAEDIEQFLQEFEVSHSLESTYGISSYQMAQKGSAYYLIMDEFEGLPLSSQIGKNQITLKSALEIAIELAEIIGNIHNKNIIHKDINPSNILWDSKSNKVRVIDFGISSRLSRDINEIMTLKQFDGTLQYISPEQTGRIERAVDYRADLYSLGITLYQI
ncbi:MAG: protein kinase, partial [Bacteroidales bacterium]|nr:protein kinase [Bacteroidales bacterium]